LIGSGEVVIGRKREGAGQRERRQNRNEKKKEIKEEDETLSRFTILRSREIVFLFFYEKKIKSNRNRAREEVRTTDGGQVPNVPVEKKAAERRMKERKIDS